MKAVPAPAVVALIAALSLAACAAPPAEEAATLPPEQERSRAEALAECRVSVRQDGLYDESFGGAVAYRVAVDDCLRRQGFQR